MRGENQGHQEGGNRNSGGGGIRSMKRGETEMGGVRGNKRGKTDTRGGSGENVAVLGRIRGTNSGNKTGTAAKGKQA